MRDIWTTSKPGATTTTKTTVVMIMFMIIIILMILVVVLYRKWDWRLSNGENTYIFKLMVIRMIILATL